MVEIVKTDDWIIVYRDGEQLYAGHSITPTFLLEALDIEYTYEWVEPEAAEHDTRFM